MASDATRDSDSSQAEQKALAFSTIGYLGMAALGIGFAISTRSEAILLDGVYSFVSAGASLAAARLARRIDRPRTELFHFGFAHLEPLLNTARGFLILAIAAFAFVSAIDALLHGGRPIAAGVALIYGGSAAALCLLMSWKQRRLAKRIGSPLLVVDARNWLVDGILSLGAGLAFLAAFLLEGSAWSRFTPYVDPALVTVLVRVMAPIPLLTLWENLREVLQVAPERDEQREVTSRVEQALSDLPTREIQVRMAKIGRFFYVMTHVVLPHDWEPPRVTELDDVRCRIAKALEAVPLRVVTDTVFTADARWALVSDQRDCAET